MPACAIGRGVHRPFLRSRISVPLRVPRRIWSDMDELLAGRWRLGEQGRACHIRIEPAVEKEHSMRSIAITAFGDWRGGPNPVDCTCRLLALTRLRSAGH